MQGYELGEKIGKGTMWDVYAGRHTGLNHAVAIKVLKPSLADDEEFVQRFLRQFHFSALFDHPNIMRVYDVGKDANGVPCIIMERLFGQTLRERIEQGPLTEKEAVTIACAILSALEYVRVQNIMPRGVEPSNIYLNGKTVKMTGFQHFRSLSGTVVQIGTPAYMSPEQAYGRAVDARSDLYGVGILLYEMLTGDVPFKADTQLSVLNMQINMPPPPLPNTISPWLRDIVARALAKKPEDRFASAAEMRLALEHGLALAKAQQEQKKTGVASRHASAPRWAVVALSAAFVLMAVPLFLNRNKDQNKSEATAPDKPKPVVVVQTPKQTGTATVLPTTMAAIPATGTAAVPLPTGIKRTRSPNLARTREQDKH